MEPKQLAQFCHTLRLRIRLGIAYACLVLALLVLGAFTAQHGWYRGFLMCGALAGHAARHTGRTAQAGRSMPPRIRRARTVFVAEIGPYGCVGCTGAAFARRRCGPVFFPCGGFCADGRGLRAPCDKQNALLCAFKKVLSAPTARRRPKRRKKRGCLRQAAPSFIHKHSTTPPCRPQQGAHAERCTQRANRRKRQKVLTDLCKPQARPAATVLPPKAQARHYAKAGMTKKYIST